MGGACSIGKGKVVPVLN